MPTLTHSITLSYTLSRTLAHSLTLSHTLSHHLTRAADPRAGHRDKRGGLPTHLHRDEKDMLGNPQRERVLCREPTGPNPLNRRDDFSRPALRHGGLNSSFQAAWYLPF